VEDHDNFTRCELNLHSCRYGCVEIYLEHGRESFEEFVELRFRKLGNKIIKDSGRYYGQEFEELKKMNTKMIPEFYEKM
jgi:hypothetical protein